MGWTTMVWRPIGASLWGCLRPRLENRSQAPCFVGAVGYDQRPRTPALIHRRGNSHEAEAARDRNLLKREESASLDVPKGRTTSRCPPRVG